MSSGTLEGATSKTKRDFYEKEKDIPFFKNINNAVRNETTIASIGAHNALHNSPNVVSTRKSLNSVVVLSISPSFTLSTISLPRDIVCKSEIAGKSKIIIIITTIIEHISSIIPRNFLTRIYRVYNSIKNLCTYGCYQFNPCNFFNPKVFFLIASYLLICNVNNDFKNEKSNTEFRVSTKKSFCSPTSDFSRGNPIKFILFLLSVFWFLSSILFVFLVINNFTFSSLLFSSFVAVGCIFFLYILRPQKQGNHHVTNDVENNEKQCIIQQVMEGGN